MNGARLEPLLSLERGSKCHDCPRLPAQYAHVDRVRRLEAKQERLRHMVSNEALTLFPDFQQRLGKSRSTALCRQTYHLCVVCGSLWLWTAPTFRSFLRTRRFV